MDDELISKLGCDTFRLRNSVWQSHDLTVRWLEILDCVSPVWPTDAFTWATFREVVLVASTLSGPSRMLWIFRNVAVRILVVLHGHASARVAVSTGAHTFVYSAHLKLTFCRMFTSSVSVVIKWQEWRHLSCKDGLLVSSRHMVHQPHDGFRTMAITVHLLKMVMGADELIDFGPVRLICFQRFLKQTPVVCR